MESPALRIQKTVWRWYSALLVFNALDLLFTYMAIERGHEEWNPILRPVLFTPWPAAVKGAAFALLACALWQLVKRPHGLRGVFPLVRSAALVYLIVIAFHLVGLSLGLG